MNELTVRPAMATAPMTRPFCSCRREKGMHIGKCQDLIDCGPLKAVDQLILTDNEATIARLILKEIAIA